MEDGEKEERDERERTAQCAAYLKSRPGFSRALLALRDKWVSLGRAGGTVTLKDPTEEERRTLGRFLGKTFWEGDLSFTFEAFEKALRSTRYGEIPVKQVLEAYFGAPLVSRQEEKARKKEDEENFWQGLEDFAAGEDEKNGARAGEEPAALSWIRAMREEKQYGCQTVLSRRARDEEEASEEVKRVCRALALLKEANGEGIFLAVLSSLVSTNPHCFDEGEPAGILLKHALAFSFGCEVPSGVGAVRSLYARAGILTDEIASTVTVWRLHMRTLDGERYEPLEGFMRAGEPATLSLANLRKADRVFSESGRIYCLENEMVFTHLCERLRDQPVTLLCTSGQLSAAALKLTALACESGETLYYAGDMDPNGMDIADRLWRRDPEHVKIWRMDEADYSMGLSAQSVDAGSSKLENLQNPILRETAKAIRRHGKAAYQESFLERYLEDIRAFSESVPTAGTGAEA